jgi:phosphate transport system substrate-binding protein
VKLTLAVRAAGVTALAALAAAACGSNSNGTTATTPPSSGASSSGSSTCAAGSLTGQGSTFQQAIEGQWTSQFASQCSGAQVTYTGTGSGAGITQFGTGTIDFAGSDVTMKPAEQTAADTACGSTAISIPVTAGGVAVIFNLKGITSLQLSAPTVAKIFEGKITTWNDKLIAADNPGVTLPSTAVKTYWRNDGSGTTSVFTSFLAADAGSAYTLGTPGKNVSFPVGQGAKGSSGVTAGVKQTDGGITYAETSYAQQNKLPTAKVKGATGGYTAATSDTVSQSIDSGFAVTGTGNDLSGKLDFTAMTGYPISTVSYVIACTKYKDAAKGTLVKDYLTYVVGAGQSQATALGFAPLPSSLVTKAQQAVSAIS